MFTSVNHLDLEMGVDKRIGRFFVDRQVPKNNGYWKGRLLYVAFGNGYVFIPVYYDILHRLGLSQDVLLDEKHIDLMEKILHLSYLHEANEITLLEEITRIGGMMEGRIKDFDYYSALNTYLHQPVLKTLGPFGLSLSSLNRADVFLFALCDLPLNKRQWEEAIRYWYALLPNYLILDDLRDYAEDQEKGDENVVLELSPGIEGFEQTFEMYRKNCLILQQVNPALATFLLGNEEKLRGYIPANV